MATLMKSLQNLRLSSLTGHLIVFEPLVPTRVPDEVVEEAMARGCVIVDDHGDAAPAVYEGQLEPLAPPQAYQSEGTSENDEYQVALEAAVLRVIEDDNDDDFTKEGFPKCFAVQKYVDSKFGKPSSAEIVDVFEKLQEIPELAS